MQEMDYDDPAVKEQWCLERRAKIAAYLKSQVISHGQIDK